MKTIMHASSEHISYKLCIHVEAWAGVIFRISQVGACLCRK